MNDKGDGEGYMLCEACGKHPATVHLTQMINQEVKKLHLCEHCASESGLDVNNAISISDVLLGLGAAREGGEQHARECRDCHMRLEDFRKSSRLGCQNCYVAFESELAPLLESMHRGLRHIGKQPAMAVASSATALGELRRALSAAVKAEKYEEAARIRDQIRALEQAPAPPPVPPQNP